MYGHTHITLIFFFSFDDQWIDWFSQIHPFAQLERAYTTPPPSPVLYPVVPPPSPVLAVHKRIHEPSMPRPVPPQTRSSSYLDLIHVPTWLDDLYPLLHSQFYSYLDPPCSLSAPYYPTILLSPSSPQTMPAVALIEAVPAPQPPAVVPTDVDNSPIFVVCRTSTTPTPHFLIDNAACGYATRTSHKRNRVGLPSGRGSGERPGGRASASSSFWTRRSRNRRRKVSSSGSWRTRCRHWDEGISNASSRAGSTTHDPGGCSAAACLQQQRRSSSPPISTIRRCRRPRIQNRRGVIYSSKTRRGFLLVPFFRGRNLRRATVFCERDARLCAVFARAGLVWTSSPANANAQQSTTTLSSITTGNVLRNPGRAGFARRASKLLTDSRQARRGMLVLGLERLAVGAGQDGAGCGLDGGYRVGRGVSVPREEQRVCVGRRYPRIQQHAGPSPGVRDRVPDGVTPGNPALVSLDREGRGSRTRQRRLLGKFFFGL
uniref:Uncharacterized protein n=1 Tax=Mycena chlorophos TaxID=658473 RepID=A0ABQ0LCP1_MYCCL|nr:predicted protein [Mycena chlorophos]